MRKDSRQLIGLTMGDPAGIGPEIILKAAKGLTPDERKQIIIIANSSILERERGFKSLRGKLNIIDVGNIRKKRILPRSINARNGLNSLEYLDQGISLIKDKFISGLVTCPVSKYSINLVKPGFRGQTEYLAKHDKAKDVRMMLLASCLKFSLHTTHIPIDEVSSQLKSRSLVKTIVLTAKELERLFNKSRPNIGICALNPHLGEGGLLGSQEKKIIRPSVLEAQRILENAKISGPSPLEKIVFDLKRGSLDAGVCLYHDQAIIPLKLLYPGRGVNLTLGLSYVRTSPLHGTAFDIAGKNKADPTSLIEAIRLALSLVKRPKCKTSVRKNH